MPTRTIGQNTSAAERSAHEAPTAAGRCFICAGPWQKGGASWAARVVPGRGLREVCGAECANDVRFAGPGLAPEAAAALLAEVSELRRLLGLDR